MPKTRGGRTARILAACNPIKGKTLTKNQEQQNQPPIISNEIVINPKNETRQLQILKPFSNIVVKPGKERFSVTSTLTSPIIALVDLPYDTKIIECEEMSKVCETLVQSSTMQEEHFSLLPISVESSNNVPSVITDDLGFDKSIIECVEMSKVCETLVQSSTMQEEHFSLLPISVESSNNVPSVITDDLGFDKSIIECVEMSKVCETLVQSSTMQEEHLSQSGISCEQKQGSNQKMKAEGDNVETDPDFNPNEISDSSSDGDVINNKINETYVSNVNEKPFSNNNVKKRKMNKNTGKEYKTAKGKDREARKLKPLRENCRNKCRDKLSEDSRHKIFNEYWGLGTHDRRVAHIASLVSVRETKLTRTKVKGKPTRNRFNTLIYNFEISGEKVQVCKICFLATLDETEKFVTCSVTNKMESNSGITHTDLRGTHTPNHKTATNKIDEVIKHINSFPAYESHYSRRHTQKKYLASNLNLNKMYQLYSEPHMNPVSIKIYAREFHKLDLKFKKPKNDTCSKCDMLIAKEKYAETEEEKMKIKEERDEHLACADSAYKAKDDDKKKGIADSTHVTYAFDLQQVLQTPHLSCNKIFYLRQLATYNLTVHNCSSGESNHFMWPECTAGRGANEIASCLFSHIMSNIRDEVKSAVFYSDTCGGQNKNSFVCSMFQYVIQKHPSLEVIDHKFLVPGHTHLECDVDHSVIERAKKKCNFDIHVPRDWYQLVRTASKKNKFKVDVMEQEHFLAFSDLISKGPLQAKNKSYKLREVCWLRYTKGEALVKFKCSLKEEEPFKDVTFFKKGQNLNNLVKHTLTNLYSDPRPISSKKKENLLEIVNLLDKDVQQYYYNLRVDKKIQNDTDPDLDRLDEDNN